MINCVDQTLFLELSKLFVPFIRCLTRDGSLHVGLDYLALEVKIVIKGSNLHWHSLSFGAIPSYCRL